MREVRVVWGLLAAEAVAVVVTYSRLPANELYNVTGSGLRGGLSRLVVELNFPDALIALAILGVLAPLLSPALRWIAAAAAVLCAYAVLPGVVQQSNLDAKWENAIPAAGVALALAMTFLARRPPPSRPRGDRARISSALFSSSSPRRGSRPCSASTSTAFRCSAGSSRPGRWRASTIRCTMQSITGCTTACRGCCSP
jgi:hypothetical protein